MAQISFPFIDELDQIAAKARLLIADGELKKAARLAKKLDRSPYSEGWVHASKLTAWISLRNGDSKGAKERARQSLCNAWGDTELLAIMRNGNPPVDKHCSSFDVCLQAGGPWGSPLVMFGEDFKIKFLVVAHDEFKAVLYVEEMLGIDPGQHPKVISIRATKKLPVDADLVGVYWNSPFERI